MRIISKRKDYYDWVAGKYGGGDPRIVYDRRRKSTETIYPPSKSTLSSLMPTFPHVQPRCIGDTWIEGYCVVAGKPYKVVNENKEGSTWRALLTPEDKFFDPKTWEPFPPHRFVSKPWSYYWGMENKRAEWVKRIINPKVSDKLIEVHREVGMPVFWVEPNGGVNPVAPMLGELGFASVFSAEQMYQDLAYFVGNTMLVSPDLAPPTAVSNKDRILQHGFDLKTSFRGKAG